MSEPRPIIVEKASCVEVAHVRTAGYCDWTVVDYVPGRQWYEPIEDEL